MVTKQDIFTFLRDCKIKHSDYVTLHTSLRAVGEIEGGADGLIDAFIEYLYDGLFIVPTHTWGSVNKANPFYDVRTSEPCIGTLPKIAAARNDGVRSLHPTHSVTVFGKGAKEYIKGEENSSSPTPPDGALGRLYDNNGKILLIGVGQERNTFLHSADERFNLPNRINKEGFSVTVTDYKGNKITTVPLHNHYSPITGRSISEFYPNYNKAFEHTGAVTYHKLGNALVYCCDAKKMTDTLGTIWKRSGIDFCEKPTEIPKEYYE